MELVYVCGPQRWRIDQYLRDTDRIHLEGVCGELARLGYAPLCPDLNFDGLRVWVSFERLEEINRAMLEACPIVLHSEGNPPPDFDPNPDKRHVKMVALRGDANG